MCTGLILVNVAWSSKYTNKQLFLNEIVFRFRKDIGSLRRPGVVIILHEKYWGVGDL